MKNGFSSQTFLDANLNTGVPWMGIGECDTTKMGPWNLLTLQKYCHDKNIKMHEECQLKKWDMKSFSKPFWDEKTTTV